MRSLRRSVIVNFGSISWHLGLPDLAIYETAKAGIEGMTRALARELGPDGIRVNAILPGTVEGPRIDSVFENKAKQRGITAEEVRREALSLVCLGRMIKPQDIANLTVFQCSPLGANISGQALSVDADAQMLP